MLKLLHRRRRKRITAEPFPAEWEQILRKNFALFEKLSEAQRMGLRGHIQILLREKKFEGCGGLAMTDEIRVTIAAAASLLLLNRETDYYPDLKTILVYPHTFVARKTAMRGELQEESESANLGESWNSGVVILSWNSVTGGTRNMTDGRNVALHEFAHQLDLENGVVDGLPVVGAGEGWRDRVERYSAWARICAREYELLRKRSGKRTVLDSYGGTHPAEFFAVATECFFEKPAQLRMKHPELYEELKNFYRQDPEMWKRNPPSNS